MKLHTNDLKRLMDIKGEIKALLIDVKSAVNRAQMRIGFLLDEVKSKKLYLEDYETMDEFLEKEFSIGPRRGYQLIQAVVTVKALPEALQPLVQNERIAREVAKLPEPARITTLKKIKERGIPVTAEVIREVHADAVTGMHEVEPVRDETGYIVPERALPFWERRFEVKQLIESLQQVKNEICKAFKEEDLLYFGRGKLNQTITTDIEDVIRHLKSVLPYAICLYCQGKFIDKCTYCNKTGVIDRNRYNAAPENLLTMRRAAIEGAK